MSHLVSLLLPPIIALLLSTHLGFAWGRYVLPAALRPYRLLLTPLLGLALLMTIVAAFTTTTRFTPLQIALGLAMLAVPLNIVAWRIGHRAQRTGDNDQHGRLLSSSSLVVHCSLLIVHGSLFFLAILPPLRWGFSAPIGSNWDAAEFYVPLARMLQLSSQRDLAQLPPNPLVQIATTPPVSGRIHAFSYLHAIASSASGVDPLQSYALMMAFVVALLPPAVYLLGRVTSLTQRAALLAALLTGLGWLPLWVAYNNFSNHVLALPLLPLAVAGTLVALRDDSWRALLTGALLVAALAVGYYPALTMYVAISAPLALLLLARAPHRRRLIRRLALLATLAIVLSGPAQYAFLFREGFLAEILQRNTGFQVDEFVGPADVLGLQATFNRESLTAPPGLVTAGAAIALALIAAALLSHHYVTLSTMLLGIATYLALNRAQMYHYGFYKGATFAVPFLMLGLAAGAERLARLLRPHLSRWLVASITLAALAIPVGLSAWTIWQVQARYTAAGPQLWSADELRESAVVSDLPLTASILLVPPSERQPTFNSLLSYRLLGRTVYGNFGTGFARYDHPVQQAIPDIALLPAGANARAHGFADANLIAAAGELRLYRRDPALRAHRSFAAGPAPAIAPGESLRLWVTPETIALPGEDPPRASAAESLSLGLILGSFEPASVELRGSGLDQRHESPGGLVELTTERLRLPAEVELRNTGVTPIYLRQALVRDQTTRATLSPATDALIQVLPQTPAGAIAGAELNVYTETLPAARQKLTGLLTVTQDEHEVGRWVFWPQGEQPLQLELNLESLTATLRTGEQPLDLPGESRPGGDGAYRATLLLANNAEIVYATDLWRWQIRGGAAVEPVADSVRFDVIALPHANTPLDVTSSDGAIRLRGYTLPDRRWQPGERLTLDLVWQSLSRIESDLTARVTLHDGERVVMEATAPIGAAKHGTSAWQEGEVARQTFDLALPASIAGAELTIDVTLLDAAGRGVALGAGESLRLATLRVDR